MGVSVHDSAAPEIARDYWFRCYEGGYSDCKEAKGAARN